MVQLLGPGLIEVGLTLERVIVRSGPGSWGDGVATECSKIQMFDIL
jgi:hypothetical protein